VNEKAFELLKNIGYELVAQIDQDWTEIQIVAEIDDELSSFQAWFLTPENKKESIDVSYELAQQFEELRELDVMSKKGRWSKCTLVVGSDGQLKTDFSYDEAPRI
jgi:hypothetical protein